MKHIINFVNSYEFWRVIKNKLFIVLYEVIDGFPLPICWPKPNYVYKKKFKKSAQLITYAPHFISVVMVGMIFVILNPWGPLNDFLYITWICSKKFHGGIRVV